MFAWIALVSLAPQLDFDGTLSSGPLIANGDVQPSPAVSPDGRWLVYLADAEIDGVRQVFCTPLAKPAAPRRISLASAGDVGRFALSPDSSRVAYVSAGDLYVAPLSGGPALRVLETTRSVVLVGFEPSSEAVFVTHNPLSATRMELFRVPADGSGPALRISPPLVVGGNVDWTRVTFVGTRVLFDADALQDEEHGLYSAPSDGSGSALRLDTPLHPDSDVEGWTASHDGTRVLYRADSLVNGRIELFSRPIDGSAAPVRLNGELAAGGSVDWKYALHANGSVVYRADQEVDERFELYGTTIDGSLPPLKLSAEPLPGERGISQTFALTEDGTRLLYVLDVLSGSLLHSVPLDHSTAPVALAPGFVYSFALSPAGDRVAFTALVGDVVEGFSAPVDGSDAPVRLHAPLAAPSSVDSVLHSTFTSDGELVFRATLDGEAGLFRAPLDGSGPTRLSPLLVSGGEIVDFKVAPGGNHVVFAGDVQVDERFLLYSASLVGTPSLDVENGALAAAGDVLDFLVPAQNVIVYRADQLVDQRVELFRSHFRRPNWRAP